MNKRSMPEKTAFKPNFFGGTRFLTIDKWMSKKYIEITLLFQTGTFPNRRIVCPCPDRLSGGFNVHGQLRIKIIPVPKWWNW